VSSPPSPSCWRPGLGHPSPVHLHGEGGEPLGRIRPRPGSRQHAVEVDVSDAIGQELMGVAVHHRHPAKAGQDRPYVLGVVGPDASTVARRRRRARGCSGRRRSPRHGPAPGGAHLEQRNLHQPRQRFQRPGPVTRCIRNALPASAPRPEPRRSGRGPARPDRPIRAPGGTPSGFGLRRSLVRS
jgi:hypothetical protein